MFMVMHMVVVVITDDANMYADMLLENDWYGESLVPIGVTQLYSIHHY